MKFSEKLNRSLNGLYEIGDECIVEETDIMQIRLRRDDSVVQTLSLNNRVGWTYMDLQCSFSSPRHYIKVWRRFEK